MMMMMVDVLEMMMLLLDLTPLAGQLQQMIKALL
jgi:hypothetical protein